MRIHFSISTVNILLAVGIVPVPGERNLREPCVDATHFLVGVGDVG